MTRILVIEDEIPLLEEIVSLLQLEGYDVMGASRGESGVQLAREHRPDLIISDIMMPGLDGYGVLLALQDDPETRHIPFIFLTARSDREHMRYGMALGADDYVTKPFTRDDLLAAIKARLARHETVVQTLDQQLDDLRESLVLALPHELRTPLTSLVGYAELLKMDGATLSPDEIGSMAQSILQAGQRLQRQIQNLLLYAQLEVRRYQGNDSHAGGEARQPAVVTHDPGDVITTSAYRQSAFRDRQNDLRMDVESVPVRIAEQNLSKITEELVDNACKFSAEGSPIGVSTVVDDVWYVLTVTDRGRGMTTDQIRRVGAYIQFDRRLYEQQGTGLGLVIAQQLARIAGGTLEIESEPFHKTQVTVTLPRVPVA